MLGPPGLERPGAAAVERRAPELVERGRPELPAAAAAAAQEVLADGAGRAGRRREAREAPEGAGLVRGARSREHDDDRDGEAADAAARCRQTRRRPAQPFEADGGHDADHDDRHRGLAALAPRRSRAERAVDDSMAARDSRDRNRRAHRSGRRGAEGRRPPRVRDDEHERPERGRGEGAARRREIEHGSERGDDRDREHPARPAAGESRVNEQRHRDAGEDPEPIPVVDREAQARARRRQQGGQRSGRKRAREEAADERDARGRDDREREPVDPRAQPSGARGEHDEHVDPQIERGPVEFDDCVLGTRRPRRRERTPARERREQQPRQRGRAHRPHRSPDPEQQSDQDRPPDEQPERASTCQRVAAVVIGDGERHARDDRRRRHDGSRSPRGQRRG